MKNYTVIVKDENGITYLEGSVSSLSVSTLIHTPGAKLNLEAFVDFGPASRAPQQIKVKAPSGIEFLPINININDVGVTKAECSHKWKQYQGLMEKYDYCDACGVKK